MWPDRSTATLVGRASARHIPSPTLRLHAPLRRGLLAAAACGVLAPLGACGTYLYDPSVAASTAQLKTDFTALTAPKFLADQHGRLSAFGDQEDAAVAALAVSARNRALLEIVRPSPAPHSSDPVAGLLKKVDGELGRLYRKGPWTAETLNTLANISATQELDDVQATDRSFVQANMRNFNAHRLPEDKRPTDCDKVGDPTPPANAKTDADRDYIALQIACRRQKTDATLADDTGLQGALKTADPNSDLGQAQEEYVAALHRQTEAKAKAEDFQKQIKTLQDQAAKASSQDEIAKVLSQAKDLAEQLDKAPALAKALGLQTLAETLEPALAHALDPKTALPADASDNTKRIAAALVVLKAGETAWTDFNTKPDVNKGDALLVAVALLTHKQKDARIEANWDDIELRTLHAELVALMLKAEQLVRAHNLLAGVAPSVPDGLADLRDLHDPKTKPDRAKLAEALSAYAAAWDAGETPYWVLRFKQVQNQRMAALERAQQAEADNRAVMAPAINTLANAGAGGLKPADFATLIGDAIIAAAILGK